MKQYRITVESDGKGNIKFTKQEGDVVQELSGLAEVDIRATPDGIGFRTLIADRTNPGDDPMGGADPIARMLAAAARRSGGGGPLVLEVPQASGQPPTSSSNGSEPSTGQYL